jgi:hypothetical protein
MRPHPIAYHVRTTEDHNFAIKVTNCAKCGSDFPFKDIILSPCRHAFHPWCAIMHFSESNYCPYEACKAMATPEWYKSFGIREFDSAMIEFEVKRGCEEVQLQIIKDRREVVLSICPDVEQTEEFNRFLKDVLGKEFLSKLFPVMQECTLWCLLCSVFLVWSDSECELKCFAEEFVPSNS